MINKIVQDAQEYLFKIQDYNRATQKILENKICLYDDLLNFCEQYPKALIGVHIPKDNECLEESKRIYTYDFHDGITHLIPVTKIYKSKEYLILSVENSQFSKYDSKELDISLLTQQGQNWSVAKDILDRFNAIIANPLYLTEVKKSNGLYMEYIPDSLGWKSSHPTEKVYGAFNNCMAKQLLLWSVQYFTPHY